MLDLYANPQACITVNASGRSAFGHQRYKWAVDAAIAGTGKAAISGSFMVPYRDRRLCSGATFPVLLMNCHGGSARTVAKRCPSTNRKRAVFASASVFDIAGSTNAEHDNGAASAASSIKPRQ